MNRITNRQAGIITALLIVVSGIVFHGCGGGGGGSLPGAVTETGTLSGRVTLPDGADPSGSQVVATRMAAGGANPASIRSIPKRGSVNLLSNLGDNHVTTADSEGRYTFSDVEQGDYFVVATKGTYRASQLASVVPSAATVVDLALAPTGSIRGRVTLSGLTDSGGDLAGTLVLVKGTSFLAGTDGDGYYSLAQVPVGTGYQLMFSRPGYEVRDYATAASVAAGAVSELDTVMLYVDSGRVGGLSGTARRPGDTAATHEDILISVLGTGFMAVTDLQGNWAINDIPAGVYSLGFGDIGSGVEQHHVTVDNVTVRAGFTEVMEAVTLQPTGIEGTVKFQNGSPVMGAMVQVQGLGREGFAVTDSGGAYEITGLDPGTYTVMAVLAGYEPQILSDNTVGPGQIVPVDIVLSSGGQEVGGGTMSGTVYIGGPDSVSGTASALSDLPAKLLDMAIVRVLGTSRFAVTSAQGQYEITGIPPGTYDVLVECDEPGFDAELVLQDVTIVQDQVTTRGATITDDMEPEVAGAPGIADLADTGAGSAMRVYFYQAEDRSEPVSYRIYFKVPIWVGLIPSSSDDHFQYTGSSRRRGKSV